MQGSPKGHGCDLNLINCGDMTAEALREIKLLSSEIHVYSLPECNSLQFRLNVIINQGTLNDNLIQTFIYNHR